jgi:hypothetical protein
MSPNPERAGLDQEDLAVGGVCSRVADETLQDREPPWPDSDYCNLLILMQTLQSNV